MGAALISPSTIDPVIPPMSAMEFRRILRRCGWQVDVFADRVNWPLFEVQAMARGELAVADWLATWLRAYQAARFPVRRLVMPGMEF